MQSTQSVQSENLPEISPESQLTDTKKPIIQETSSNLITHQPSNSPLEVEMRTPTEGENTNFSNYSVKEIGT
jgi:hypothetical protein